MLVRLCRRFNRKRQIVAACSAGVIVVGLAILDWRSLVKDRRTLEHMMDSSRADAATRIHDSLFQARTLVDSLLGPMLKQGTLEDPEGIRRELRTWGRRFPRIHGVGIAIAPEWLGSLRNTPIGREASRDGRWAVFAIPSSDSTRLQDESPTNYDDSSNPANEWYTRPSRYLAPSWTGPRYDTGSGSNIITFSRPLLDGNRAFAGVIRTDYSLSHLRRWVAKANTSQGGYSCLVSRDGTILYHPRVELMDGRSTIRTISRSTRNPALDAFADSIQAGSPAGSIPYRSIFTGETTSLRYDRVRDVGWYVLSVVPDTGSRPLCTYQKHLFLLILASVILCAWAWLLWCGRNLWYGSIGISGLFALGIVLLCWLAVAKFESGVCTPLGVLVRDSGTADSDKDCSRTPLANGFAASAFLSRCFEIDSRVRTIPTGIQLQTTSFNSAYSFSASGFVWQRYRSRSDTGSLGVELPEIESANMEIAYDDSLGPTEFVRGWRFDAQIRQPFEYRLYPLDKEEIWIRMRPRGLSDTVMLEPDFASYAGGTAGGIFGLDQNLVLPQWKILGTNFSYARNTSSSSFGRKASANGGSHPELYFSMHVRRNIFDAFISQFIPLLVIILMLFSILWVGRKSDERGLLGFTALSGSSGCSAVFFIVIYNHISLRSNLGAPGVVYMEAYFFVTYLAILYVSLNSIMVAMDHDSKFINFGDNLLSRILYWPLVTGLLFLATFVAFY